VRVRCCARTWFALLRAPFRVVQQREQNAFGTSSLLHGRAPATHAGAFTDFHRTFQPCAHPPHLYHLVFYLVLCRRRFRACATPLGTMRGWCADERWFPGRNSSCWCRHVAYDGRGKAGGYPTCLSQLRLFHFAFYRFCCSLGGWLPRVGLWRWRQC